jgi:hypothetical protein
MPNHEPDPDPKPARSPAVAITIAAVLALPVLYVLADGPVARIFVGLHDGPLRSTIIFVNKPLAYLCSACEPIGKIIWWYERLWMP